MVRRQSWDPIDKAASLLTIDVNDSQMIHNSFLLFLQIQREPLTDSERKSEVSPLRCWMKQGTSLLSPHPFSSFGFGLLGSQRDFPCWGLPQKPARRQARLWPQCSLRLDHVGERRRHPVGQRQLLGGGEVHAHREARGQWVWAVQPHEEAHLGEGGDWEEILGCPVRVGQEVECFPGQRSVTAQIMYKINAQ